MYITKRNGSVALFETEKIAASILKANANVLAEHISQKKASLMAEEVMERVVHENEIVTTNDIHKAVYALLEEELFPATAASYKEFAAAKPAK